MIGHHFRCRILVDPDFHQIFSEIYYIYIPSRELTYPIPKALLKMIFLFPRWDMLISWRVYTAYLT